MSKTKQNKAPRNWIAKKMIEDGIGKSSIMKDRRDRRAKEHEDDWKDDWKKGDW